MYQVTKRDGKVVDFDLSKISDAITRAFEAQETQFHPSVIDLLALKVTADFVSKIKEGVVSVEDIQDSVESVLVQAGYAEVAKAYILYRRQRQKMRDMKSTILDYKDLVDKYVKNTDWRVKENSTVTYSVGGLILSNSGAITANYWLSEIYDDEIANAHNNADIHIHDLAMLTGYCAGWSLKQLIKEGLGGVPGKITSAPASHLSTLCNQMVNFLGIMQNEWAGAQAFSSFDTYLAPFVKVDNLSYYEVKKCIESLLKGGEDVEIIVVNDGSKDNTVNILKKYEKAENIHVSYGENVGVMKSFFELLAQCEDADYYSFADQDDIWDENKLERAMNQIGKTDIPVLYCADFYQWNCNTGKLTPCRHLSEPFSIVKTIVNGDSSFGFTQVLNSAMRRLALRYMKTKPELTQYSHDMWCHLFSLCFGQLIYDKSCVAHYRRYGNNVSTQELHGGNRLSHRVWQIRQFLFGSNGKLFREDIRKFLEIYKPDMTHEQLEIFELFLSDNDRLKKVFWKERIRRSLTDEIAIRILFLLGKV